LEPEANFKFAHPPQTRSTKDSGPTKEAVTALVVPLVIWYSEWLSAVAASPSTVMAVSDVRFLLSFAR